MNKSRRATLATILGGVAAAASFNAVAHRGRGGMHGSMDVERMLRHLYAEIDATDEQKQRLEPIVKQTMQELAPLRQNLRAARGEALKILSQDRVDSAALESLRARQIQLTDEASRTVTRALVDASEVLNPAQRRKLAAYFARGRRFT